MTIDGRLAFLLQCTESLHASTQELHVAVAEHTAQIADLIKAARQDGENIAALARIAAAPRTPHRQPGKTPVTSAQIAKAWASLDWSKPKRWRKRSAARRKAA